MPDRERDGNMPDHCEENLTPAQRSLHKNFVASIRALRRDLVRAGYYLLHVKEQGIYRFLGYSRIQEYAESVAGLSTRQCQDLLTMARRLPEFREVESAFRSGSLGWSQATLIVSRTHPQDQLRWLGAAREKSVKNLRMEILESARSDIGRPDTGRPDTGRSPTDRESDSCDVGEDSVPVMGGLAEEPALSQPMPQLVPEQAAKEDPLEPRERSHYVTVKFTGPQYALWQRLTELRRRGEDLADRILTALAGGHEGAHILETVLVVLECPGCKAATTPTSRGEVPVPAPLLEAARCDAVLEGDDATRRRAIPPRMRRRALRRARYRCENPGCGQAVFLQVHHRCPVAGGGTVAAENLIVLCWRCHRELHARDLAAREALRADPG